MKRIILGISVFLMLVQNGFAEQYTDAQYDKYINRYKDTVPAKAQLFRCIKVANNYADTGDVNECLKSIENIENGLTLGSLDSNKQKYLAENYLNAGVIYKNQFDTVNAYKYYLKAAKLGNKIAPQYLDNICKQSPWVCK